MTKSHFARTAALILGFTIAAGATAALPALRDNAKIRDGLISTAIALSPSSWTETDTAPAPWK